MRVASALSVALHANCTVCEVCLWEDDGGALGDLDEHSGPNHMTLREGRDNFRRIGACDARALAHVLPVADRVRFRRVPR
ncbi:CPCC family cysteine-rich protein [Sorangium sp. So ce861]|uniref:CPCC family cysteine-rich protein n=1 Tax=Sorangium sp. So ce861 TaxID=3133323 RepID=UPI003F5DA7D6